MSPFRHEDPTAANARPCKTLSLLVSVHGFSVENVHRQPAKCSTAIRKVYQLSLVAVWIEFVGASPSGWLVYGRLLCTALRLPITFNGASDCILNHAVWRKRSSVCVNTYSMEQSPS